MQFILFVIHAGASHAVRVIPEGTVPHLIGPSGDEANRKSWSSGWLFYLVS